MLPTQGVLAAFGLLAGLLVACRLALRLELDPDRIWNLGLGCLLTFFLGERVLVIAFHLRDFGAHPFWMLGVADVRAPGYGYAAGILALCAGWGYVVAWRLSWAHVVDCLAPGSGLALACMSLGPLVGGPRSPGAAT
ncbi:MAG TPA: hypothetical protein VGD62_00630, partial [Acidobacteriaceae bacterium]